MAKMFLDVFNLSITASWLIVAVILVRLVIRHRAPKWVTCLLWTMVGIRLVIPFSLESAVSLIPSRETIIPESVYGETVVQTPDITPPEQDNPDVGIDTPNEDIGTPNEGIDVPDEYIPPAIENIPEEYIHSGIGAIDDRVNPIIQSTATIENGKSKNILQTVTFAASCVWILGMVSLVIYAVINYLLLKKRIATSIPEGKDIRKSEAVGSPFILGVFRPRIYMPFGLSKATEEHVLAHERAHLKRGDHLIKPIGYAILTVHWFNPLVWLGYILLCRDIEYACDEKVVKNMSAEARKAYAEALLECGVSKSRISACPVAFGETGVKKRVKNTLNYKKPLFWVMIAAIIICAAVAVLFLTSPAADKETSDTSDVSDVVDVSNVSDVIDESDVSLPPEEVSKPEEEESISELLKGYPIIRNEETLEEDYLTFAMAFQKTNENRLGKFVTVENSISTSNGLSRTSFIKELSVGTTTDFTVVRHVNWKSSYQVVEEYNGYSYFNRFACTDREYKYYHGEWHDSVIENSIGYAEPGNIPYSAVYSLFTDTTVFYHGIAAEKTYDIISNAINTYSELEFIHNSDGTISARGTMNHEKAQYVFGYNFSDVLYSVDWKNCCETTVTITYNPETGDMTGYQVDVDIETEDGWYKYDVEAVIIDADGMTVPSKEDAIAGNW